MSNGNRIVQEGKVPETSGCRFRVTGWVSFVAQFLQSMNRTSLTNIKSFVKIKGFVSKETVVLRWWESIAGNLVLTTGLKT